MANATMTQNRPGAQENQSRQAMPTQADRGNQQNQAEFREGDVARAIEQQTAKLPSDLFLWAAGGSIVGSILLQCTGAKHASLFVGQWAPTLLILGLYNKMVKIGGSDRMEMRQMSHS